MKKLTTYFFYFIEYVKHGDFKSIIASVNYLISKKSHKNDRIIKTSVGTFFCRKNTNDFQFANYRYEWGIKHFISTYIQDFDLFIDGGACVGHYSILFAKKGIPVIAFEAVPQNAEVLRKNIEMNGLSDKIRVYQLGLSDKKTVAKFIFDPINTGASHISREDHIGDCDVTLTTLDTLMPELDIRKTDRIIVKLDLESMEDEAIKGAEEFIKAYPNITFILEDKHTSREILQNTLSEIATFKFGIVDEFNMYARKLIG